MLRRRLPARPGADLIEHTTRRRALGKAIRCLCAATDPRRYQRPHSGSGATGRAEKFSMNLHRGLT
jgi:hypothetical protein